jgi:hypothetical protein
VDHQKTQLDVRNANKRAEYNQSVPLRLDPVNTARGSGVP